MNQIEEIKQKLNENNEIIELLTIKKQQEAQMRKIQEEREFEDSKSKTDSKYVTKAVAAQEVITYLSKVRSLYIVLIIVGFLGVVLSVLHFYVGVITSAVVLVIASLGVKRIKDSCSYLINKYQLPGYVLPNNNQTAKTPIASKTNFQQAMSNFFNK